LFLDIFFQKSTLDRKTTNATKAVTQTFSHVVRALYFGSLAGFGDLPFWGTVAAISLAIAGTSLAPLMVERMSDHGYRQWTRTIILAISVVYLARGGWLLWAALTARVARPLQPRLIARAQGDRSTKRRLACCTGARSSGRARRSGRSLPRRPGSGRSAHRHCSESAAAGGGERPDPGRRGRDRPLRRALPDERAPGATANRRFVLRSP